MMSPASKKQRERVTLFEAARRMPSSVLLSPTPLPRQVSRQSLAAAQLMVGGAPVSDAPVRTGRVAKLLDQLRSVTTSGG